MKSETREDFVEVVKNCYDEGKIGIGLLSMFVENRSREYRIFITEEEFEQITGQKF